MSPLGWLVAFILGLAYGIILWINGTVVGENQTLIRQTQADRAEYVVCAAKVARLQIRQGGKR